MTLYIQGTAPAGILKDLGILPQHTEIEDYQGQNYITHVIKTRTASSALALEELLLEPGNNPDRLHLTNKDFTDDTLEKIERVVTAYDETNRIEMIQTLRDEGKFTAFISLLD